MKYLIATAVTLMLSSGLAFAQTTGATGKGGGTTDAATYLSGPNISKFYTDDTRTMVRPPEEFKKVWNEMNETDRADVKQACSANRDVSFNPLCTNIKGM